MEQRELLNLALQAVSGNQAELARRLGRSETTVSRWVTGRNGIDFESALRLARLTGLPPQQAIEACGLDPSLVPPPPVDAMANPDVAAISAVWPTADEGIQRAVRILLGIRPVSAPRHGRLSERERRTNRGRRASDGPLSAAQAIFGNLLVPALSGAR